MTFPIKKRIITELFIEKRVPHNKQKGVRKNPRAKEKRVKSLSPRTKTGQNEKPYRQPVVKFAKNDYPKQKAERK